MGGVCVHSSQAQPLLWQGRGVPFCFCTVAVGTRTTLKCFCETFR